MKNALLGVKLFEIKDILSTSVGEVGSCAGYHLGVKEGVDFKVYFYGTNDNENCDGSALTDGYYHIDKYGNIVGRCPCSDPHSAEVAHDLKPV